MSKAILMHLLVHVEKHPEKSLKLQKVRTGIKKSKGHGQHPQGHEAPAEV
jgi:hypothetical protein